MVYRRRMVIEHRVMRACNTGNGFMPAAEVTAVRPDVSHSGLGIW